jgi:Ca2+/Na+ antiporter
MFPSACSVIVLVFTASLHVSAYVAIFRCVGFFIFIYLKKKAEKSSEAESFKHMKLKYPANMKMRVGRNM